MFLENNSCMYHGHLVQNDQNIHQFMDFFLYGPNQCFFFVFTNIGWLNIFLLNTLDYRIPIILQFWIILFIWWILGQLFSKILGQYSSFKIPHSLHSSNESLYTISFNVYDDIFLHSGFVNAVICSMEAIHEQWEVHIYRQNITL